VIAIYSARHESLFFNTAYPALTGSEPHEDYVPRKQALQLRTPHGQSNVSSRMSIISRKSKLPFWVIFRESVADGRKTHAAQHVVPYSERVVTKAFGHVELAFDDLLDQLHKGVVSPNPYYHKERNWAAERAGKFSRGEAFYLPVAIDNFSFEFQRETRLTHEVQATRALGGELPPEFIAHARLIQQRRTIPLTP